MVDNGGKEVGGIYSSGQWTGGFLVVGGRSEHVYSGRGNGRDLRLRDWSSQRSVRYGVFHACSPCGSHLTALHRSSRHLYVSFILTHNTRKQLGRKTRTFLQFFYASRIEVIYGWMATTNLPGYASIPGVQFWRPRDRMHCADKCLAGQHIQTGTCGTST